MSTTSLYDSTTTTGVVSTTNTTSLYSNTTNFTTGQVNTSVLSVSGSGAGISVDPTTGHVVVSNTGVTSIVAGAGISISGSTGAVTVSANPSGVVTSITGTADEIIVSSSTGAVVLSTPQPIATTSTPTFAGATIRGITLGISGTNTITTLATTLNVTSATGRINANPVYITPVNNTAVSTGIGGTLADATANQDYWHVGGYSIGGAGANDGALEIATANNGNEPIYVRQYSGGATTGSTWPFGNTVSRELILLDGAGQTSIPGTLFVAYSYIGLKNNSSTIDCPVELTTSTTTPNQVFDTFPLSTSGAFSNYHTGKYIINATSCGEYHGMEVMIVGNTVTSKITSYNEIFTSTELFTVATDVSGGLPRLLVTPVNAVTTFKANRILVR